MSIKLVVWDWNGTILDDVGITVQAINSGVLPLLNLPEMTVPQYQDVFEVPIIKNYLSLGVSETEFHAKSEAISQAFHSHYEPLAAHAHTRRNIQSTLAQLQATGIHSIILSNHTLEGIYLQLARLELEKYFVTVLANDDIEQVHRTGKQHRVENYLSHQHFQPHEVVIVGDTAEEVTIGKSLGLHTIVITEGFSSRVRLEAAKPDYIVSSVNEIITIVEEMS